MDLITVKTFQSSVDANIWKSKLESEGIQCVLFDENIVSVNPLYNVTVGGIKLKIHPTDVEKASEIVEEMNLAEKSDNRVHCIKCGSQELITIAEIKKGWVATLIEFYYLIVPVDRKMSYQCKNCGEEFRQ